jgi:hypothetical protein
VTSSRTDRRLKRTLTVGALATSLAAVPSLAYADAVADPGLDFSLSIPEGDISTVGPTIDNLSGGAKCKLGSIGLTTLVKRTSGLTSSYEAGTAKASSTCADITVTMTIVDHDLTGTTADHTVSRTTHVYSRKGSSGTSQTVSWAATTPAVGLRPATRVSFKGYASSGSGSSRDTSCVQLDVIVLAGSVASTEVVPC